MPNEWPDKRMCLLHLEFFSIQMPKIHSHYSVIPSSKFTQLTRYTHIQLTNILYIFLCWFLRLSTSMALCNPTILYLADLICLLWASQWENQPSTAYQTVYYATAKICGLYDRPIAWSKYVRIFLLYMLEYLLHFFPSFFHLSSK